MSDRQPWGEGNRGTRKIAEARRQHPCLHPAHKPPQHRVYSPGLYVHTCPACGQQTTFRIAGVYL